MGIVETNKVAKPASLLLRAKDEAFFFFFFFFSFCQDFTRLLSEAL